MSFYENQERARQKTGLLVFYFFTAVVLIIAAVNTAVYFTLAFTGVENAPLSAWFLSPPCWITALSTLAIIVMGSLFRMAQLSKGGVSVALMVGATPLNTATNDHKERQLLNIVEEMAIASGTPVPRVFVMKEESGINAFVAGTESRNTILAVTQGALDHLNREELQGVIGHEFSHILNGDMRLNVKLIGILAGILLIGKIGEYMVRSQRHRSYRSSNSKNGNQAAVFGLALLAIGYVGLFFGRLIKAAISRQREFLADASSVQFTRNPSGIGAALYRISQHSQAALLANSHAEDMSHMCFGDTINIKFNGLLATHPPLEDRIKAIDPGLLPRLKARFKKSSQTADQPRPIHAPLNPSISQFTTGVSASTSTANNIDARIETLKASVGSPTPQHVDYAQALVDSLPQTLIRAAHNTDHAAALTIALLLMETPQQLWAEIVTHHSPSNLQRINDLTPDILTLPNNHRLPLLDITLATLKSLPLPSRQALIKQTKNIIRADHKVTLTEFLFHYLIKQSLGELRRPPRTIKSLAHVEKALAVLLSALVQVSGETPERQQMNFIPLMSRFSNQDFSAYCQTPPSAKRLFAALDQLNRLIPLLKQPVIDACVDCVLHDSIANTKEIELLRAISESLECPMPPLLSH